MNIRDLRYMLALADHQHFGRAADACGVSQPTLSGQIKKLEDELGLMLFERTTKLVIPTGACDALLAHARIAVAEIDALVARAQAAADPLAGRLRIGIIPTLGPYLLPLVFGLFRERLPRLDIEPWEDITDALLSRLRLHELDAALVAADPGMPELTARPLFTEPFLAALPPDHPLAREPAVAEEALAEDLLVLADGHCLRGQALAACGLAAAGGQALRAASLPTLINMVAAGYGTTLIPGLATGAAEDAGLKILPLRSPAARTIWLAHRPGSPRDAAIAAVGTIVATRLQGCCLEAAAA